MTDHYRFRIAKDGIELELEGDLRFIEQMITRFMEDAPEGERSSEPLPDQPTSEKRPTSPSEFIRLLGFKKHTDRVLAFGYFLEMYRSQASFTSSDINALYYESKLEASNTSQMFNQLVKRGHLMMAKNSDSKARAYTLTRSGEEYIEEALRQAAN